MTGFTLSWLDYCAFGVYLLLLTLIGAYTARRETNDSGDYFLAGRKLPWYVVGGSFIASNISSEHFIGMVGAAYVYGVCVSVWEWGNIWAFSALVWIFIPFLLASRVFTTPEFLERRFNATLRQLFAVVTVISNVIAFLAAVLYGGGMALHTISGWDLTLCIVGLGLVAGIWAIVGGLRSVAWTDFFTVLVMLAGGATVTVLGLLHLAGDGGSLLDGWQLMLERNAAADGPWREAVAAYAPNITGEASYDRLSVIQPANHPVAPWPSLFTLFLSVSIWYNVINQFMIQRVLGARDMYHARMGIVLAGYMKIILPALVVAPGMILFALHPEWLLLPKDQVGGAADKGYVALVGAIVPAGLRGLFLAALFGAIQSTVNSVLNSTATIFTLDIYKRVLRPRADEPTLVKVGMLTSVAILAVAIVLGCFINKLQGGLFTYIQELYAFFAPPFAAVFLLGILFRRINGAGATAAVITGFAVGLALGVYQASLPGLLQPFPMRAFAIWCYCVVVCVSVSLLTPPPAAKCVTDQLTLNWRNLNITDQLGTRWYNHVLLWWGLFVLIVLGLVAVFS